MEKWKIGVIVLLLGGLAGYGFYQQNAASNPVPPEPAPGETPKPANQKLLQLQGQTPPAWNIPQNQWVNTPEPISFADLKGNVALLEFWRMGCHHCEQTVPFINSLQQQYSPRGLKIVTIHSPGAPGPDNPENDWSKVQRAIKDWKIKYPVAFDEGGQLFKKAYGGETYPALFILNRKGEVASVVTGHTPQKEIEVRRIIEAELKKK